MEGTLPFAPGGRLKVDSAGGIVVRGDDANDVRYSAKKRVRADSQAEAKGLLGRARFRATREGSTATLVVDDPGCGRCEFSAAMKVSAPRGTREAMLSTRVGAVEVYDLDGRVTAATAGGAIQMDRIGQSVRASSAGGPITLGTIGGPVRVETAGGAVKLGAARGDAVLTTSAGPIDAGQIDGSVRAETAGGSIRLGSVKGGVTAETAGGSIHLIHIGGPVVAETAGGSITVESSSGGVRADNANGTIKLLDVAGALRAETASGNIWAQLLAGHVMADSLLETSMGTIVVVIPLDVKLTIRALVEGADSLGRIQSDFPGIQIRRLDPGVGPGEVVAEGVLNGGGPVLRIRNTAGTIQIKRR